MNACDHDFEEKESISTNSSIKLIYDYCKKCNESYFKSIISDGKKVDDNCIAFYEGGTVDVMLDSTEILK
jgi:hypothetical protein